MIHSMMPIFYCFGVLMVFSLGALFGAAIVEDSKKRAARVERERANVELVELVEVP